MFPLFDKILSSQNHFLTGLFPRDAIDIESGQK